MNFRFIPVLASLESRENPSVPFVDPIAGSAPPPTDPAPAPVDPTAAIIGAATGAVAGTTPATTTPADPLTQNNSVYNIPLVP